MSPSYSYKVRTIQQIRHERQERLERYCYGAKRWGLIVVLLLLFLLV